MASIRFLSMTLALSLLACLPISCSRNPNIRKQKYYASGLRYFQKAKYREAAIEFQNALQIDPRYRDAHYQLARCYLRSGVWNRAYTELMRAIEAGPHNWKARMQLADLLLAAGQDKEALEEAQQVLSECPDNPDARALLANAHAMLGNPQESLKDIQRAIQLAPDRSDFYVSRAEIQARAKHFSAAEESFKRAIDLDSKSAGPYLALGAFYARRSRFFEAEEQCWRAMELEPQNPGPWAALARAFLAEGQKSRAEQVLKDAKLVLRRDSEGCRMLGDFYLYTGQLDRAAAEYASLCKEHPEDLQVKGTYVRLLVLRDRLDEAAKLNDDILKQDADNAVALNCRGVISIRQGHPDYAIQSLQAGLEADPSNAYGHYNLGVAYNQLGRYDQAEREWQEAVRLRPGFIEAQQTLAIVAQRKGDVGLLAKCAEGIIAAQPSFPLGYIYRAMVKFFRTDDEGAEADLKKAIELAPQNPLGYTRMGDLRASQRKYKEAAGFYVDALQRAPDAVEALAGLVRIHLSEKQTDKAIACVKEQISRSPSNGIFYLLLGDLLAGKGDLASAEGALQKAVALNKNNPVAYRLLAWVQAAAAATDRAVANSRRTIHEDPSDARSFVLLASLEQAQGNWQRAQALYGKALEIDPNSPIAANNLAYLMLEHGGSADVALHLAQVARRRLPHSPNTADTLALAFCEKGMYQAAVDLLQETLRKAPKNATYHYHLALAYQKMKDPARAKEHFEQALKLGPKHIHGNDIRKALTGRPKG